VPQANDILAKGKAALHSDTMWYDREYVARHIGEIGVLAVGFLLLSPSIGYVWYPKSTPNHQWVGVVIIEIMDQCVPGSLVLQAANYNGA